MRVLLAEDDATTRLVLETQLTGWGYEVVSVDTSAAAWRALQEDDSPELALLDWELPEMDGLDVCRQVQAAARTQRTHIFFVADRRPRGWPGCRGRRLSHQALQPA